MKTWKRLHWCNRMEEFIQQERKNTMDLGLLPLLDELHCEISRMDREYNFGGCMEAYFRKIVCLRNDNRRKEEAIWRRALEYTFPGKVQRTKLGSFKIFQMYLAFLDQGQVAISKVEIEAETTHEAFSMILDAYLDEEKEHWWDVQKLWSLGTSSITGLKDRYNSFNPSEITRSFFIFAGPLIRPYDLMGFEVAT